MVKQYSYVCMHMHVYVCPCVCGRGCGCVYCMDPSVSLSHFLYPLSHLLMDILVAFIPWLLQTMLLRTLGYLYLFELVFWGLGGCIGNSRIAGSYGSF